MFVLGETVCRPRDSLKGADWQIPSVACEQMLFLGSYVAAQFTSSDPYGMPEALSQGNETRRDGAYRCTDVNYSTETSNLSPEALTE